MINRKRGRWRRSPYLQERSPLQDLIFQQCIFSQNAIFKLGYLLRLQSLDHHKGSQRGHYSENSRYIALHSFAYISVKEIAIICMLWATGFTFISRCSLSSKMENTSWEIVMKWDTRKWFYFYLQVFRKLINGKYKFLSISQ